jgi:hypothetical protein
VEGDGRAGSQSRVWRGKRKRWKQKWRRRREKEENGDRYKQGEQENI